MKRVLLAGVSMALLTCAASAADLPRRAAPPVFAEVPLFSWTGVYIGTHTAYTFSDRTAVTTTGLNPVAVGQIAAGNVPASVRAQSGDRFANIGGGFGINYQFTPGSGFVVGAAVDADWTSFRKSTFVDGTPIAVGAGPTTNVYNHELSWLMTTNGRVGYAFDRFLVYGTGGAAIGHVKYGYSVFSGGAMGAVGSDGGNTVGYNYGGGIEYAIPTDSFLGNLNVLKLVGINLGGTTTLKAEYIHYNLGSQNVVLDNGGPVAVSRFRTEGNMVRAGFSYKFP